MPRSTGGGDQRRVASMIGAAIDRAMKDASGVGTQEVLAERLAVDQTTVSKWIRGATVAPLHRIEAIESICGLPRGQVLVWAGLVESAVTWDQPAAEVVPLPLNRRRPGTRAASGGPKKRPGPEATRPSPEPEPEGP